MLGLDPPDHTRLRGLVAKAFTPKTVEQLSPHIQRLTDGFLEPLDGEVDLMPELALKLPITVISEMLGVPTRGPRRAAAAHQDRHPQPRDVRGGPRRVRRDLRAPARSSATTSSALADEKRTHPDDGMFTDLVHAEEEGDKLTEAELISTVILLFVAGYETTTNLIGNGTRAFLLHPEQLAAGCATTARW